LMIFERRLVGMERKLDYTFRGFEASSRMMDGLPSDGSFKRDSFLGLGLGLVLFSVASSLFLTPLPIFFSEPPLALPTSLIFVVYMLSSFGAIMGYFIIGRRAAYIDAKKQMRRVVLMRSLLVFMLVAVVQFAFFPTVVAGAILVFLGFAYALYYILMISLSMELIPAGRTGLFDVLVGLGAATGSFLGPFLATLLGFLPLFAIAGAIFLFAFVVLKILT
jgi:MFS family permease